MKYILVFVTGVACLSVLTPCLPAASDEATPNGIFEALPEELQIKVASADKPLNQSGQLIPFYVITTWKKWRPGQTLRVSFQGGSPALHRRIADIASEWTRYANLHLDFSSPPAGTVPEIRISFNQAGYWSLVGTDSINPRIVALNEASMNLSQFDTNPPGEAEFRRVVLHEFGHALGLQHEHQNPEGHCDDEFDWPKVRTYLKGAPNHWSDAQIDFNLKQLPVSSAYETSSPDRLSIMFYHFAPWMFLKGAQSPCCVPNNTQLSPLDQQGIAQAYPSDIASSQERLREGLSAALSNPALKNPELKRELQNRMEKLSAPRN